MRKVLRYARNPSVDMVAEAIEKTRAHLGPPSG